LNADNSESQSDGVPATAPKPLSAEADPLAATERSDYEWDVFVSFRHKDARQAARELRLQLQNWRLPQGVSAPRSGRLKVYLDTFQGRVTQDYWTENIAPALRSSRYLLVVVSESIFDPADDGTENWVQKEIREFIETPQRANIIPVYAPTQRTKQLPKILFETFPRIQTFDLGSTDSFIPHLPFLESPAKLKFVRIVAAIRGVRSEDYPNLFREEWRRRVRSVSITGLIGLAVLCAVAIAGVAALVNGIEAVRTTARTALRLAVEVAVERPDEAALQAVRALRTAESSYLYKFFLHAERARARGMLGSLALPSSTIVWPGGRIAKMALSSDGNDLAVWTENFRLAIYDASSMKRKRTVTIPGLHSFCDLIHSQDTWLLSCSGSPAQIRLIGIDGSVRDGPTIASGDDVVLLKEGLLLRRTGATGRLSLMDPLTGEAHGLGDVSVGPLESAAMVASAKRLVVHTRLQDGVGYEQRLFDVASREPIGTAFVTTQIDPRPRVLPKAGIFLRYRGAAIEKVDLGTGKTVAAFGGEGGDVSAIHASEDGKLAVVARSTPSGSVEIWNTIEARQIARPLYPVVLSEAPVFSPSGTKVAIMTPTGVFLADAESSDAPLWLPAERPVNEVVFSADGKAMAVADLTGKVSIFDASDGKSLARGVRHRDGGVQLALLPDGRILSGGWDGSLRATSLGQSPKPLLVATDNSGQPIGALAAAPDAEDFVYASPTQVGRCTSSTAACKWRMPLRQAPVSVDFAGKGRMIVLGFGDNGSSVRDSDTGREIYSHPSALIAFSAQRSSLAVLEPGAPMRIRMTGRLGRPSCEAAEPIARPLLAKMTGDGDRILVLSTDGEDKVSLSSYDARDCRRDWISRVGLTAVNVLSISEPWGFVAVGGASGGQLFNLQDGSLSDKSLDDRNMLSGMVFSTAEPTLLTLGASRKISAYDLRDGGRHFTPFEASAIPWQAQFTSDGHRFAVAFITANDRQQFLAQTYDAEVGMPLGPPMLHPRDVLSIAITPRFILTGCTDGFVRAWAAEPDERSVEQILNDLIEKTGETIDMAAGAIRAARGPADAVEADR